MPNSKQRRAAERRRLERQAQRRQEQAQRRRRTNLIVSIVGTLAIIGVIVTIITVTSGSDPKKKAAASATPRATASSTATTSTAATSPAASSTVASSPAKSSTAASSSAASHAAGSVSAKTVSCSYPTSGTAARKVTKPSTTASAVGTVTVQLTTSRGALTFVLDRAKAPCTVNSFVSLAKQKYYTGTSCHRLVTANIFVLQCGDPTGTGSGGPGYKFNDELTGTEKYTRGVLAMANGGANTNGSQFFIVDKASTLGPSYTIFGKVSAGLGVVDRVSAAGTADGSTDGKPKLSVTFTKVTVG